jgi:Xaa-Pro aminopeptidase
MAFSPTERKARYQAIQEMMKRDHLQALLLIGDTNVGPDFYGDFRYMVDNRIIFYRQVALVFAESEPVLFAGSPIQRQAAERRSSVKDCRFSDNFVVDIAKLLKERGVSAGRVGVNFEVLPVFWHNYLRQELSRIEWIETHKQIMDIRFRHTEEEANIFRKGGPLADGGYEAVLNLIRPGVSEFEIASAIEDYARARGAEQHFTLIGSGKFILGDRDSLPLPSSPSSRRIETGDSVVMEITPCYEGYWTQLVRTVNVGRTNHDLEKLQKICCGAIRKGLEVFGPGKTVKQVVLAMEAYVTGAGYLLKPPLGHLCGVDLIEARVSPQNEMVLQLGMAVIIHPTIFTPDGKNSFFCGETYLVTKDRYERLHKTGDELLTV